MTNTAKNSSQAAANTSFFTLHNPADPAAVVYQFDTLEDARAFKNTLENSAQYRVARICFFDDAVENGGA